jgi:hypothetical protein
MMPHRRHQRPNPTVAVDILRADGEGDLVLTVTDAP